ncbi:MAG: hypothetical protein P8X47_11090 [Ignavibacteriaceae bacterium]
MLDLYGYPKPMPVILSHFKSSLTCCILMLYGINGINGNCPDKYGKLGEFGEYA